MESFGNSGLPEDEEIFQFDTLDGNSTLQNLRGTEDEESNYEDSSNVIKQRIRPKESLSPPENFSFVISRIFRSSFPVQENFEFLETLKLKSIICLIPDEYPEENVDFLQKNGIQFFQVGLSGNKEPFVKIKPSLIVEALKIVLNPQNQPILIHCNRGKHRTGCLVGCLRKLQKWSLSMIFDEYRKFAYPKERPLDQQFIEMFEDEEIENFAHESKWLPLRW